MKIDFNNKIFSYLLKENNVKVEDKIECEINFVNNNLEMKYNISDELIKIIIQILE